MKKRVLYELIRKGYQSKDKFDEFVSQLIHYFEDKKAYDIADTIKSIQDAYYDKKYNEYCKLDDDYMIDWK